MLNKVKSFLLGMVKSVVSNNLGLLDTLLTPELNKILTEKGKVPADTAALVARDVVALVKDKVNELLAKI